MISAWDYSRNRLICIILMYYLTIIKLVVNLEHVFLLDHCQLTTLPVEHEKVLRQSGRLDDPLNERFGAA